MAEAIAQRLIERRANVWEAAKEILDRAADESRALSGEEEQSYQAASSEIDTLDERIKSILAGEKRAKETEAAFEAIHSRKKEIETPAEQSQQSEIRSFLRGDMGRRYDVAGQFNFGPAQTRTGLVKATNSAGGYTVPTNFYDQLVQHLVVNSGILAAGATVLNTAGGAPLQVPKTTAHPTASLIGEGATITESDPTFSQVTLNAYKFAVLIQLSHELVSDTGVDLMGYLAERCGLAVGNTFGAYAITGTGSSQPTGVVVGASAGVTGGSGVGGAFTADNLIDLFYSVTPPYRASGAASWLMQDSTLGAVRKLKDSQNRYLWEPNYQVGAPDTVLGKPVHTDPNVAAVGLGNKSVLFGDFSRYFVRLAEGVRFEQSADFAFNTDLITVRCIMRADGNLIDTTGAIKYFAGNAA